MWHNIWFWIINVALFMVLHLLLVTEMLNMVWVLGPPTFTSRKLIVGLMVAIFCHIRVGIIHQFFIQIRIGILLIILEEGG